MAAPCNRGQHMMQLFQYSKLQGGRQRTEPLTHRQIGVYDILFAQQKDVSHIDVVSGHIHTEELLRPCTLVLQIHRDTFTSLPGSVHRVTKQTPLHMLGAVKQIQEYRIHCCMSGQSCQKSILGFAQPHLKHSAPCDEGQSILPMPWMPYEHTLPEGGCALIGRVHSCTHLFAHSSSSCFSV